MHINYKLNTNDLDANFLESVKIMFKDKDINISIVDTENDEDFALGKAMEEGLLSKSTSREEPSRTGHVAPSETFCVD